MNNGQSSSNARRLMWLVVAGIVVTVAIGAIIARFGVYGDRVDADVQRYATTDPQMLHYGLAVFLGLVLTVAFPRIWFVVPLLLSGFDNVLFVRDAFANDGTMWPFGLMERLVWTFWAYVGAAVGIVYLRWRRAGESTP